MEKRVLDAVSSRADTIVEGNNENAITKARKAANGLWVNVLLNCRFDNRLGGFVFLNIFYSSFWFLWYFVIL